jgi:hypothetical protein
MTGGVGQRLKHSQLAPFRAIVAERQAPMAAINQEQVLSFVHRLGAPMSSLLLRNNREQRRF